MTDPKFVVRSGEAGRILRGTPGHVLTFEADGETLSGQPGGGGACTSNGAIITGAFACAENNNCEASGDSSNATGDGTRAAGFASCSVCWSTQAVGAGSFAANFDTAASADTSFACGNQSQTFVQSDFAHASGAFADRGDAQWRFNELKGTTPGLAAGESVDLQVNFGTPNELRSGVCYYVVVTAIAIAMGVGAGSKRSQSYERRFLLNVDSAGAVEVSTVEEGPDLTGGVGWGASLLPQPGDFSNSWKLTYQLNEGTTLQTRILAHVEYLEVLGD